MLLLLNVSRQCRPLHMLSLFSTVGGAALTAGSAAGESVSHLNLDFTSCFLDYVVFRLDARTCLWCVTECCDSCDRSTELISCL